MNHEQAQFLATDGPPGPTPAIRLPPDPRLLALGGAMLVCGALLAVFGSVHEHASPASAVRRWHAALKAGDLAALRDDERLGMQQWTRTSIANLGDADHRRVLGLYDQVEQSGQREYQALETTVLNAGQNAYNALGWDERRAVDQRSHREWVLEHGYPSVPEATAVGGWQALLQWPPPDTLVQQLGTVTLNADEQGLLANRAANDAAIQADPMLRELAGRRSASGTATFRSLHDRVERAGEQAFRQLPFQDRQRIDGRSRSEYVVQQGLAGLAPADRARVPGPQVFTDSTAALAFRRQLGMATLAPSERLEVERQTREVFVSHHDQYVVDTGGRLLTQRLREIYGASSYEVEESRVLGTNARDLIQRGSAWLRLKWMMVGAVDSIPGVLDLEWVAGPAEWRISGVRWRDRRSPPGAGTTPPAVHEAPAGQASDEADGGAP